jgi:peptide/histidine transporter 3/4
LFCRVIEKREEHQRNVQIYTIQETVPTMMNCCLAQLQTFSVQQGNIMNRTVNDFKLPTQSLSVFPLSIMLASIPLYEHFIRIFGNKIQRPLGRIGLGLALASGSMAVAAIVEAKRREAAQNNVTLSVFWLGWQYLLLGVADMFTLGGMLDFFYSEAADSMRSMSTALSWCSTSMGYFLSSLLVSLSNWVTAKFGRPWLWGNDLNHARLDLFYALLSILNLLNLFNYIYWAKRY